LYDNKLTYVHRQGILELLHVQVNVLVWICVQQNSISILVLTAYFTVLLVIRMNLNVWTVWNVRYANTEYRTYMARDSYLIPDTWQTVIGLSHIFHFKGADVRNVCNYVCY